MRVKFTDKKILTNTYNVFCGVGTLKKIKLNIKGSDFIIKQGDIFLQEGLKVINFNEYFDTIVDNKIIAKNSLNGKFITEKVKDLEKLDSTINWI